MPHKDREAFLSSRRRYYETHKEEMKARMRAWWATHKEEQAIKAAQWRATHQEQIHANRAADYAANHERYKERAKAHRLANPDKHRAYSKKKKAYRRGAEHADLTAPQWQMIKEHYGHRCVYCGRKMKHLTQDHITPLSKGGHHTLSNVVPACATCNTKKKAGKPPIPVQPLLL